jgi:long-subunit fatty acid transport protein
MSLRTVRGPVAGLLTVMGVLTTMSWLDGAVARAVPLDDPDIGGIGFSGPTTGDLAAVYWNPAALGLLHGLHLTFAGTGRLATTNVSGGNAPGGSADPGDARAFDRSHPLIWPPGPGAFAGIGGDAGGDRFALAFAAYMPFVDRTSYETTAGESVATRYHRISADLRNLALVPALSIRFWRDLRLGFAPGFLFSTGRLLFAESTCAASGCLGQAPSQDPSQDARLDLGSGQGILSSRFAVTLAAGLYFRSRAWEFGLSFSSRPLGDASVIAGDQSQITRAAPAGAVACPGGRVEGPNCVFPVFADIAYKFPYTIAGSVSWHPKPGWEATAIARILSFAANDVIDIRLTGAPAEAGVPAHIVLYRGYGTVFDTRLRVASWVGERLRVGAGLRFESSALPDRAVSPAAVDGRKLEPTVMILYRPAKHLSIAAGYGFTYMFPVTTTDSVFHPSAAADCAAAGGDLGTAACVDRLNGTARPTAAGSYSHHEHDFSLSMTAQF